jgi:hypothetical protein
MDALLGFLVMLLVPAYLVLQPWALFKLRDKWRIAGALPLLFAIPAAIYCRYALVKGSTSGLWSSSFLRRLGPSIWG